MNENCRSTRRRTRYVCIEKTEEDKNEQGKGLEHDICVITWNVNKSSAQYDFLRDMAQCQATVSVFQETQNWQNDGTAEETGWTFLKEKKERQRLLSKRKT